MLTRSKALAQREEAAAVALAGTVHVHPALRQAARLAQMDATDALAMLANVAAVMPPQKDTGRGGLDLLVEATEIVTHPVATTATGEDHGLHGLDVLAEAASVLAAARTDTLATGKDDVANKDAVMGEGIVGDARTDLDTKNKVQPEGKSVAKTARPVKPLPSRASKTRKVVPKDAVPQASASDATNMATPAPSNDAFKELEAATGKLLVCASPACTFSTPQRSKMLDHVPVHEGPDVNVCNAPIDDPLWDNRCPYKHRNKGKMSEHRRLAHGIVSERSKRARNAQELERQGTENVARLAAPAVEDPSAVPASTASEKPNAPAPKTRYNLRSIHNAPA